VYYGDYRLGLQKTGITVDTIPHMYGMNRILKDIGWAAVAVDGFIPPSAFMEFQAYNVLVIAADIRSLSQIQYTPAPDIIHEAAGHAPIIADSRYAEYLRLFGEIGCKAFSSKNDYRLYEAIRHLSILKADPYTPAEAIQEAESALLELESNMGTPSEMARIRNLHWWTVEYGLIGEVKNPKIYGAGLLSSIGESYSCMQPDVAKIPYSIAAADQSFDITRPQPQLFVTPDFETLTAVLLEFAEGMALRRGGVYGLEQALNSGSVSTVELSSGLQVSGVLDSFLEEDGMEIFIRTRGDSLLSVDGRVLQGHGTDYHQHGYSSPLGPLHGWDVLPEDATDEVMQNHGVVEGRECLLTFVSGIELRGVFGKSLRIGAKNLIWTFSDCSVQYRGEFLFRPEWGMYDMALGAKVSRCWSGPADPEAYGLCYPAPVEKTHKIVHDENSIALHRLYQKLRDMREEKSTEQTVGDLFEAAISNYSNDWLLFLEMLEMAVKFNDLSLADKLRQHLQKLSSHSESYARLIADGLLTV
jgi:phenylalanine-4-hydroxylase